MDIMKFDAKRMEMNALFQQKRCKVLEYFSDLSIRRHITSFLMHLPNRTPLHPAKLAHEDCLRMGFFYKKHYGECRRLGFEAKTDFDEFRRFFTPTIARADMGGA